MFRKEEICHYLYTNKALVCSHSALLRKTLPSERPKKMKDESGIEMLSPKLNDLSQSERRLLLSGKMQRVLDKACHGDIKRFRECNETLDKLEQSWAREDTLI